MELYVLRHGTTEWNRLHLLQGHTDVPLDEEGRKLAAETGRALRDVRFDLCYSSPLSRAVETARLVLGERDVPILTDPRLEEMNFGDYEGHDCLDDGTAENRRIAEAMKMDMHHFDAPPGGETIQELIARTKSFYDEITQNPAMEDKRILVSMHGGSGRALMLNAWGGESFWHGCVPKNCTICIVKLSHGAVTDIRQDVVFYKTKVRDFYAQDNSTIEEEKV